MPRKSVLPGPYICIHGHFYQPPRENPWTGQIEIQEGASPFHDWNERIAAESYSPNLSAQILGTDGEIEELVNNYSWISFNFGPTLLRWMEKAVPETYRLILAADQTSRRRFSGHGSAIAQVYHHTILPLSNRRDKVTEVHWGIRDFQWRFGRKPEGIWLAETAVDVETLEVVVDHGIAFTILSPSQAARVCAPGEEAWEDVSGGRIDPRRPYLATLPSGRSITLFFYDGTVARGVAFQGLLSNGEDFARQLISRLSDSPEAQLVHVATDGETYGHHHRFGEMALAYALRTIRKSQSARLTIYGEFLQQSPATWRVEILQRTAWSCAHGVGRWSKDCGCQTGAPPGWNQKWRKPLREALNWLRDTLAALYEYESYRWLRDPWKARNDYIEVVLREEQSDPLEFLCKWSKQPLRKERERARLLELFEMQRYALMMFTSCGWFFNDISGIETVQILRYAARAIEKARELFGVSLEEPFLERLALAQSNFPEEGDGRDVYLNRVLEARP